MSKTNKERLQDNNIELQNIKTGIDNLPEYQDLGKQNVIQADVRRGRTFYDNSGKLVYGSGPNIVINQEDISTTDANMIELDRSIILNNMRFYKNVLFGNRNKVLYAQTQDNKLSNVNFDYTITNLYIGMDGVYGDNSIILGIYSVDVLNTIFLYKYDFTANTLEYFTKLNFESATYFALNPFRNYIAISSSSPTQKIYRINNDLSVTQVYSNNLTSMVFVRWLSKYRLGIYNGTNMQPKYYLDYYENNSYTLTTNGSYSSSYNNFQIPMAISPNNKYAVYGCCVTQNGSNDNVVYHCIGNAGIYNCSVSANGNFTKGSNILNISTNTTNFQYGNEHAFFVDDYTFIYFYNYSSSYTAYIYKLVNKTWTRVLIMSNYRKYTDLSTYNPIFYYGSNYKSILTSGGKRVTSAYIDSNLYVTSFNTTADASKLLKGYSAAMQNSVVDGTMPNNGALNYTPTSSQQTIPAGYTSGGIVAAIDYSGQGALSPQDTATAEAQIEDLFGEGE